MIAQSKAGSGKTGAFGLAMLEVIDPKVAAPQALCLSPTRELAMQTLERLKKVGRFLVQSPDNPAGITSSVIMGGLRYERVTQHLLVATPGKLLELIKNRLIDLSALRIFTVDEADDMVVSFQSEVETIKKAASVKRAAGAPPHVQVLLFSASFDCIQPANPGAVKAKNFVDKLLDKPARTPTEIFIRSVEDLKLKNVTHFVAHVKPTGTRYDDAHEAKVAWIAEVYEFLTAGKSLIFSKVGGGEGGSGVWLACVGAVWACIEGLVSVSSRAPSLLPAGPQGGGPHRRGSGGQGTQAERGPRRPRQDDGDACGDPRQLHARRHQGADRHRLVRPRHRRA
jgi:superfamily II DNA/RNA helicase